MAHVFVVIVGFAGAAIYTNYALSFVNLKDIPGTIITGFISLMLVVFSVYLLITYSDNAVQSVDCDRVVMIDDVRYIAEDCIDAR